MRRINHHIHALCDDDVGTTDYSSLTPVQALISLLPRVSPKPTSMQPQLLENDFYSTTHHSLVAKAAPAEPPTQLIAGEGLSKYGVINDVPARLMYTQISQGEPRLVWKLEVEMKDNWYEAYVDSTTGELLRIVDWASDYSWDTPMQKSDVQAEKGGKQKPLPKPHPDIPKKVDTYTYQVFPWGRSSTLLGADF